MMEHYVGRIYNFISVPSEQKVIVDIPFFEQDKDLLTDEILINIPKEDIKQEVTERYNQLNEIPNELLKIIKKNGTSVDGQLSIYYALERDIKNGKYDDIAWIQMPEYKKILYILKLAENNTFSFEKGKGVVSVEQLTLMINQYRTTKSMKDIVNSRFEYKKGKVKKLTPEREQKYYDQAIEEAFHIYRHWFQFTVPKAFRVVDSLQRYVCEKNGLKPGSYSFFVQQLENDFLQENISILVEYGLPRTSAQKIGSFIPEEISEDQVMDFIVKNKDSILQILSPYERERLLTYIL